MFAAASFGVSASTAGAASAAVVAALSVDSKSAVAAVSAVDASFVALPVDDAAAVRTLLAAFPVDASW